MKFSFADVFNPDIEDDEGAKIAQSGKVSSRIPRKVLHPACATIVTQRTNVSEEVIFGSREDDAIHPPPVVAFVDIDPREAERLAGPCPPGSHQRARDLQGTLSLDVCGQLLEDLAHDFRRKGHGRIRVWWVGSLR